ncbi:glycosyltransferase family 4 protein [Raineyella sp. W15-4]|uniref:glycosyltransferase family 4 protein n=1 Tax=Raineyella sp. W15-4 TaxID=3081651 RepID=UPI0029533849|nr:glycosyltransferase family 4 protein [Raineyella sp. W15-4]WOQ16974.1 glycosyltransferase family 4 protein [Raineyella sp. W15-4]
MGFFSQWYEPEPGPAALTSVTARALAARGHEVHVLTGFPNYPTGTLAAGYRQVPQLHETLGGVHVTRVPLYLNHNQSAAKRLANYASFGLSAALFGVPLLPELDALWVNYSPITIALPMWLQQITRGTPTVCEVADLWPDTMAVSGLAGAGTIARMGRSGLERWCNAMYASSDAVVYISPGVGPILEDRGVPRERLRYIPKPADEQAFHPSGRSLRTELDIDPEAIVLVYAGTMGAAQGLGSLVEACALVNDPRLVVLLAGSGTQEGDLRSEAAAKGTSNIRFLGRLPQSQMANLLATADAAYVSLARYPLSAVTMPSKTQSILAAGRAILVTGTGDVVNLVDSHRVGFSAMPGDPASISQAIRGILQTGRGGLADMGRTARLLYEDEFSVDRTTTQVEALLGEVSRVQRKGRLKRTKAGSRG